MKFIDGKFKILILADIHGAEKELKWTFRHIEAALKTATPDLVVLLGDNITGRFRGVTKENIKSTIEKIGKLFDERNIPFALVFGNHDHEGLCSLGFTERDAKRFILNEFKRFPTCLSVEGEEMTGVGNYNLPLLNSAGDKVIFNLWFMDSNPYADEREGGGYGYVHSDQIAWYEKKGEELKNQNGGENVPSFLFQHIIVPEIYEMLSSHNKKVKGSVKGHGSYSEKYYTLNKEHFSEGSLNEGPCPPDVKSEQFSSWLRRGDILAAFFGHDHVNDFSGRYKGIDLHQVPAAGFFSYGNNRGSRVVTLYEDDIRSYDTKVLHCGDICELKISNPFIKNHGYYEYTERWRPILLGAVSAAALCCGIKVINKK